MFGAGVCPVFGQLDPNDPWPKFGRDERNTCYSPNVGPHAPALRWWARLHEQAQGQTPEEIASYHHQGAAVAYLAGGTDPGPYILVGSRGDPSGPVTQPHVAIFKSHYDPNDPNEWDPVRGAIPVGRMILGDPNDPNDAIINSTPAVLPTDRVVVQTAKTLELWDVTDPRSPTQVGVRPITWSPTYPSSPAWGPIRQGPDAPNRVFAHARSGGQELLYCLDPTNRDTFQGDPCWTYVFPGAPNAGSGSTPAIGPIADDPQNPDRNFVYAGTFTETPVHHLFALFADEPGLLQNRLAWSHGINDFRDVYVAACRMQIGTLGSPSVHHGAGSAVSNRVLVGSDEGGVYPFFNKLRRREGRGCDPYDTECNVSSTAGLTPSGKAVLWNEHNGLYVFQDTESGLQFATGITVPISQRWVWGAPALDRETATEPQRVYLNTPGNNNTGLSWRVVAYSMPDLQFVWGWLPEEGKQYPFDSPVALSDDATLYCVNHRYIFAISPPVGEFNGDKVTNTADIDALVAAFEDRAAWEKNHAKVYGINLLGVGDANGDHKFNGKDIVPLTDKMATNRVGDENAWRYFCERRDYLRTKYGE